MNPERWEQIKKVYQSAVEIEPGRRETFLRETCAGDEALLQEVQSLLAQESGGLLDSPALDAAARALAEEKAARKLPDLVGQTLQHYRIEDKIGEGGMGVVYRARDEHLKRDVAIKVLPPELVADPERKRRFAQEARAASALSHPNIVTIHDIASEAGRDFIVMEYVAGKTLDRKIGRKGMKLNELLKHAIQIADALAAAHAAGIVHRDVKPANILVTESGQLKVLDFGLAKLTQPLAEEEPDVSTATGLPTGEGRIMGTAAYMSPEQAQGKAVDARSDVFSFGSVLYEMATGRRAFQGDSSLSTLSAVLNREPAPMSEEIPRELEKLVAHCLRKDPTRRFQHMGDVKIALEDLKEESDSGDLAKGLQQSKPARRRAAAWIAAAALLVLAAVSALVYWQRTSSEAPSFTVVPLTSYPRLQLSPSFSPDGSRVAFYWNGESEDNDDIYIKPIGPGPARRLTSDPAPDRYPRWSPDGNSIAFNRLEFVYLISPEGGPERKLTTGLPQSWTPDGRLLAIQKGSPARIYLVSVETGEVTGPLASPAGHFRDLYPIISPDGRSLAFIRFLGMAGLVTDIYILPLTNGRPGGEAWRLTDDNRYISALTWTPDGREIVFNSNRDGRRSLFRIAVSPGAVSQRIPGTDDASGITISEGPPGRLVYSRRYRNISLWRMRMAGRGIAAGTPERVVASMGDEYDPQFSPDGSRIAFRSDRSGFTELMVSGSDGSNPFPLTSFKGSRHTGSPRWSPDGRRIAFDSEGPDGDHIFVIEADGGPGRRLTGGEWTDNRPSWSQDGRWVYFGSDRSGTYQVWKVPATGGNAWQITRDGGWEPFEALNGKVLFYTKTPLVQRGIWSVRVDGGEEAPLPQLSSVQSGCWAISQSGIHFVDLAAAAPNSPVPLKLYSFDSHRVTQVGAIEKIWQLGATRISVTRDGRWIVWMRPDRYESNLMLIENFR